MEWRRGFTLVELLVVGAIIAILTVIFLVSYTGINMKIRDSHRQSDLSTIGKAIDSYALKTGANYPASDGWIATEKRPADSTLANVLIPKYISEIPCNPKSACTLDNSYYIHVGPTGWCSDANPGIVKRFRLYAHLEGGGNIDTPDAVDNCVNDPAGANRKMNYRIGD